MTLANATLDPTLSYDPLSCLPARAATEPPTTMELRIVAGLHRGARRRLRRREVLMIGSAADCDLILADGGVGAHHCVLTQGRDGLQLRALDSPLQLGSKLVAPGDAATPAAEARIRLGDAEIAIAAIRTEDAAATPAGAPPRRRWQPAAAAALVVAASASWWLSQRAGDRDAPPAGLSLPQLRELVQQELRLPDVEISLPTPEAPRVRGVVPDERAAQALKTRLHTRAPQAQLELRTGTAIARDVAEILRLKGIEAQTRYLEGGRVEVRGHLGDERALAEAIQSRAMRDIDGLRQVVAFNLDARGAPPQPAARDQPKRIVTVVSGRDPYVVTADGARYFVGATLPGGVRLSSIEDDHIVLDDGARRERRSGVGTVLGQH